MKASEAIETLIGIRRVSGYSKSREEALDMAISALEKQEGIGNWIIEEKYTDYRTERCPVCGFVANRSYIQDMWKFCPNCGHRIGRSDEHDTD